MNKILAAAEVIASARRARLPLSPLDAAIVPQDEAAGYEVQATVSELLSPDFGGQVGYKIGCTSAVMQRYLNIGHPCAGSIFARDVHQSGASLEYNEFVRVGVECEIAVRLFHDLAPLSEPFRAEDVAQAVDSYMPAIEIVDDRYADWQTIGAPTLIADDFFAAGCVLGDPVPRSTAPDLLRVVGRAVINGTEVARGSGADVLGHPHRALAWLANHLAVDGKGLRAGQIVLTGSLVKTVWLGKGDRVAMDLAGLGTVSVDFRGR